MIQIDGRFFRVTDPCFELKIPRWEGREPATAEEADATITLPDGTRYAATFMTARAITELMNVWRSTGDCLNGDYFWCADLIIIGRPGIPAMVEVVHDLIRTDELPAACAVLPPADH